MAQQHPTELFSLLGFQVGGDYADLTFYTSKRGKIVWFLKAPPKEPPTDWQIAIRNLFRTAATLWQRLEPDEREEWNQIPPRCSLCMTGYNLFVWYTITQDITALHTLERQSGVVVT